MGKIKAFFKNLSLKDIIFLTTILLSFCVFCGLGIYCSVLTSSLEDQQAADRWSEEGTYAQASAFFAGDVLVDEFQIKNFEHQLEAALKEAAVTNENTMGRLYVDAYSAQGKITVVSEQDKLEAQAIGIGGDFFLFHPLSLVCGSYFSGNALMKDSVILDEEAAWKLFGSAEIEGMSVMIGDVPHYVAGVIKREKGRFAESAGLKDTVVYLSCESLAAYGESEGISTYEVLAPEPVKGFVSTALREKFGLREGQMLVVDNSARFSTEAMISLLFDFGVRSMQNASVRYPYWENIARGYEDVCALLFAVRLFFLLVLTGMITVMLIIKWKNRKMTTKEMLVFLVDKRDEWMVWLSKKKAEKSKGRLDDKA